MKSDSFHKQNTLPDLGETSAPSIPKEIGPYKIDGLLNKGGMSYLYLATHPKIPHPVAVKVLSPKYFKNKEIAALFLKEASIIKMANHPNIVQLYGQGEWEKGLYIAMEFVRGVSLRQFILQKSFNLKRSLEIILQVGYALSHLHAHGVVHRDLKPENILINETGEVKVIDFGIAHLLEKADETFSKKMIGTPVYMSPEQKADPAKVTAASDIYSLAVVAYELISGKLSHGLINLQLVPKALAPILSKALSANVEERYQSVVELITDISEYLSTVEEEKGVQTSEEILHMIAHARSLPLPALPPAWNQLDMGLAIREGELFSGLYLDFFHLSNHRYCFILAEPIEVGASSLIHSMNFRGMVRLALYKKDHPLKILQAINQTVHIDPITKKFSFSLLLLSPETDQLSYVSSSSALIHIPEGKSPRELSTPNEPLGALSDASFLETVDNWAAGDTLIFHTLPKVLPESLLSPKAHAEHLMESANPKKTSAALVIQRMF